MTVKRGRGRPRKNPIVEPVAEVTAIDILQKAVELKKQKTADYQGGKWSEEDYFPFGDKSYLQMLHTKYLRMRNVAEKEDTNFEALEDTLIDMVNYAAMYAAYVTNKKGNK